MNMELRGVIAVMIISAVLLSLTSCSPDVHDNINGDDNSKGDRLTLDNIIDSRNGSDLPPPPKPGEAMEETK